MAISPVTQQSLDQQQATMLDALNQIEGIDTAKALSAMSGQTRLYLKLVKGFTSEQLHRTKELNYLDSQGDHQTLGRRAHSLKTYSAYIGAYQLSEKCAKLESLCNKASYDRDLLSTICDQLDGLISQLSPVHGIDPKQGENSHPPHFTVVEFKKLLMTIIPLLKQGNAAVDDVLPQVYEMSHGTEYELALEQLVQAVDDIEFEQGAQIAQQLLTKLD